jgi:hypothetical protein
LRLAGRSLPRLSAVPLGVRSESSAHDIVGYLESYLSVTTPRLLRRVGAACGLRDPAKRPRHLPPAKPGCSVLARASSSVGAVPGTAPPRSNPRALVNHADERRADCDPGRRSGDTSSGSSSQAVRLPLPALRARSSIR